MTAKHHPWVRFIPAVVVIAIIALVVISMVFLKDLFGKPAGNPKKMVQTITVIAPPPPPPPEQKIEEPPPPEEEPEPIDEPEPVPEEIPDAASDEPPPGADLGVDAEGGAGGDGFGLISRKGGRSLLGGNGNNPFAWYTNVVQQDVLDKINENEKIRKRAYRVTIKLWIDTGTARVKKVELTNSTGDKTLDKELAQTAMRVGEISEKAPIEMPQPIKLFITSRM